MKDRLTIICGDALTELRKLPDESVQCCVTSPPYWSLRDYGVEGQLGLEKTPEEYVAKLVEIFREVRRVLRKDGTLWLNLGDSYASRWPVPNTRRNIIDNPMSGGKRGPQRPERIGNGLKEKDLVGIPWLVAFALRADGWWLRSDIIWAKPNPMPESCTDRPTKSHEYVFLLTKSANYYYDCEAIREKTGYEATAEEYANSDGRRHFHENDAERGMMQYNPAFKSMTNPNGRNKRSVWTIATAPYPEAHFATYPPDLIKPCILAGTSARGCCAKCVAPWERIVERTRADVLSPGSEYGNSAGRNDGNRSMLIGAKSETLGWQPTCKCLDADQEMEAEFGKRHLIPCTILDPFAGSGTTGMVALELGRKAILIELNPQYIELIKQRCDVTPGLALT